MTREERDELLIRVDERTARLEEWCNDHQTHHRRLLYSFITATISVFLAGAAAVIDLLTRSGG